MKAWRFDPLGTFYKPAEFRRELGVCLRTFKYYRKRGIVPKPAEIARRGYKGTISLWTADQVARTKARLVAERADRCGTAVERLGHARTHRMELQELGRLAWELVRVAMLGEQLRAVGCDCPLTKTFPRNRRTLARAEILRTLALYGVTP